MKSPLKPHLTVLQPEGGVLRSESSGFSLDQEKIKNKRLLNNPPGTWRTCYVDLEVQEGLEDLVVQHQHRPEGNSSGMFIYIYILTISKSRYHDNKGRCRLPFLP